ncbi:hypothetical protein R6Q59_002143 [Mikania micrantha]
MCPVLDRKERKGTTMEASTSKNHTTFVSMPKDKNMKHENDGGGALNQPHCGDDTASSSSFDNTFSDAGACEYGSDNEVMSDFRGDLFPMRKKRVTSHWRKFVQPIMWRCKWVELQLQKFQSMAIMYDKEIEKHNQTKRLKYKNFELEGGCARSMPFLYDSQRDKHMKRKIRKKHEDMDPELYMSQHNLFSYFATCRSPPHGPTMDDDQTNLGSSSPKNGGNEFRVPDELLSLEFRDDYSLEQILWKIEVSQSQVSEMKTRLDTLMSENSERILSTEDLSLDESNKALTCPVKEPDYPTNMEGPSVVATFASQLIKLNTGDNLVKPEDLVKEENAAFEASHLQDANKPVEEPPVSSRKQSTDGIRMYGRRAKKPQTTPEAVKIHPEENLNTASVSASEDSSQNEQPPPKIRSVSKLSTPMNTKKRAARTRPKSGSSQWTRKTSS